MPHTVLWNSHSYFTELPVTPLFAFPYNRAGCLPRDTTPLRVFN